MPLIRILLRYVPMITFPIALVAGIIGYNVEHAVSNVETPSIPSILEEKLKRKNEQKISNKEFIPNKEPPVLERNLSPPLQKHH